MSTAPEPEKRRIGDLPDLPYEKAPPQRKRAGELYDDPPCDLTNQGVASANECTGLARRELDAGEADSLRAIVDIPPQKKI